MTVTLCNGKGGSGKTTLSVLLASALAEAGHETAILDVDPQKTATRWLQESASPDLSLELARNGKQYSAMFIDTPPRLESRAVADSVRRADIVILVSGPSPVDLFTSRDTVAMLDKEGVRKKARLLFNQVQPRTILSRDLADLADRIGLPPLKSSLQRRQAYQHAVLLGWKSLPAEAREEVLKAALEIAALAR